MTEQVSLSECVCVLKFNLFANLLAVALCTAFLAAAAAKHLCYCLTERARAVGAEAGFSTFSTLSVPVPSQHNSSTAEYSADSR